MYFFVCTRKEKERDKEREGRKNGEKLVRMSEEKRKGQLKKLYPKLSFGDSPLFVQLEACLASVCREKNKLNR